MFQAAFRLVMMARVAVLLRLRQQRVAVVAAAVSSVAIRRITTAVVEEAGAAVPRGSGKALAAQAFQAKEMMVRKHLIRFRICMVEVAVLGSLL